jgi:4-aminobutyrate aminotransferase/(S)-3-amino-2-methylpropionate transaminase
MGDKITNESLNELRTRVVASASASVLPWYAETAKGAVIRDVEGREYVDFAGGIGTMNVGHCHPKEKIRRKN